MEHDSQQKLMRTDTITLDTPLDEKRYLQALAEIARVEFNATANADTTRDTTFGLCLADLATYLERATTGALHQPLTVTLPAPRVPSPRTAYGWIDFDADESTDNVDDKYVAVIGPLDTNGCVTDELAIIVHRTCGGRFPLDGDVANNKRATAQQIVDALNAATAPHRPAVATPATDETMRGAVEQYTDACVNVRLSGGMTLSNVKIWWDTLEGGVVSYCLKEDKCGDEMMRSGFIHPAHIVSVALHDNPCNW